MNKPLVSNRNSVYFVLTVVLFLAILLLTGCMSLPLDDSHVYLTPVPNETLQVHEINQPVDDRLEAVMAAHYALQTTRIEPMEKSHVIYAEKMTLKAALNRIDSEGKESNSAQHFSDGEVWLVVYEGRWRLLAPAGDYTESQEGCSYAVIKAESGNSVSMGLLGCEKIDLSR